MWYVFGGSPLDFPKRVATRMAAVGRINPRLKFPATRFSLRHQELAVEDMRHELDDEGRREFFEEQGGEGDGARGGDDRYDRLICAPIAFLVWRDRKFNECSWECRSFFDVPAFGW